MKKLKLRLTYLWYKLLMKLGLKSDEIYYIHPNTFCQAVFYQFLYFFGISSSELRSQSFQLFSLKDMHRITELTGQLRPALLGNEFQQFLPSHHLTSC